MAKIMWKFATKNFTILWLTEPDTLDTAYMEKALAKECRAKVNSGKWKCFSSEIRVVENGSKRVLGSAFLGGSIYAKPEEFRDHFGMNRKGHGSYFSQMVREAVAEARKLFPAIQTQVAQEVQLKQKLLALHLREPARLAA